jgi:uncharacterized protein YjfI (DUF2170 family)
MNNTHICPNCNKQHVIEYGEKVLDDGKKVPFYSLGFVTCTNGKTYLVLIGGSSTYPNKPENVVFMNSINESEV